MPLVRRLLSWGYGGPPGPYGGQVLNCVVFLVLHVGQTLIMTFLLDSLVPAATTTSNTFVTQKSRNFESFARKQGT